MRFQIIGHACLLIEHLGKRLLIDPWILGSAYWRSWWHFPESVPVNDEMLSPNWICLTHEHFDHFHYPSMRKFDRSIPVLVPEFALGRMKDSVQSLGFTNVVELRHGKPHVLGDGLTMCFYQFAFDDSAVIVDDGQTILLNLNDSKVSGASLRQILKRYPRIDFVFKSHAPAQGYPICYEAENPMELSFRRTEDYIGLFVQAIEEVNPRYAIPFASNVCHLHKETFAYNPYNVTPADVAERCRGLAFERSRVVVMTPGDTWSSANGFKLQAHDAYENPQAAIAELVTKTKTKLDEFYREEETVRPEFDKFYSYISRFIQALPPGINLIFRPVIIFDQPLANPRYWVIDFRARTVTAMEELPSGVNSIVRVHPAVLMDAISKGIVNLIHISKRLHVWVRNGGMKEDFKFWGLLRLYEMGYLPLRNLFRWRAWRVFWARRAEVIGIAQRAVSGKRFEEKVIFTTEASSLMRRHGS
jgi:UDP-MurNAc hydroxylase